MHFLQPIFKWIKKIFQTRRWEIISFLWLCGFAFGFRGFSIVYNDATNLDKLYLTVQLIFIESGNIQNPPLILNIARFFLPLLAAQTSLSAFTQIFMKQTRQFSIRFSRSHIVIFGNGMLGYLACKILLSSQMCVVYVTCDDDHYSKSIEEMGAVIIYGKIEDEDVQLRSNMVNAERILAFYEDDAENIEIAFAIEKILKKNRKKLLPCIVHIKNKMLNEKFINFSMQTQQSKVVVYDAVNIQQLAARTFMKNLDVKDVSRLYIYGYDGFCEQILIEMAYDRQGENNEKIKVYLGGENAESLIENISATNPFLDRSFQFVKENEKITGTHTISAKGKQHPADIVLLRSDLLTEGIYSATAIRKKIGNSQTPIYIILNTYPTLDQFMVNDNEAIYFVGIYDEISNADILLNIKIEQMAKEFHHHYEENQHLIKERITTLWQELPENIKESNRRTAQKMCEYLQHFGYRIISCQELNSSEVSFSQEEITYIAQKEHERWLEEKQAQGWCYGQEKNNKKKTNPYLKPWNDLTEDEKGFNYAFVRIIPTIIRHARLQIVKHNEGMINA